MIVTTGNVIKVEVGRRFRFERSSERPGLVVLYVFSPGAETLVVELPTDDTGVNDFVAAYQRCATEDVGYRKQEDEPKPVASRKKRVEPKRSPQIMAKKTTCSYCKKLATWVRSTQFSGDHPFCDAHAEAEVDFNRDTNNAYWYPVTQP